MLYAYALGKAQRLLAGLLEKADRKEADVRGIGVGVPGPVATAVVPDATAVFDVDSIGLTNVVARLNQGFDIGGQAIGAPTAFHIGVAANPGAISLDQEIRRFEYKVEAGAETLMSLPAEAF